MSRIYVGISGWEYQDWQGSFYPDELPRKARLAYLARQFPTVEINGTFYSLKQPQHFRRYYEETPKHFRFSVKGGQYITHMKRLSDVRVPLANHFASGVLELREKLGPQLWQLPANFRFDAGRIATFLEILPRTTSEAAELAKEHDHRLPGEPSTTTDRTRRLRHALEVRHPSFCCEEFVSLLHRHGVALVFSHSERWPYFEDITAGFVYARLHGPAELYSSPYDEEALTGWSERIRAWHAGAEPGDAKSVSGRQPPRRKARDVYVYFDNTDKIHAPANAARMLEQTNPAAAEQSRAGA